MYDALSDDAREVSVAANAGELAAAESGENRPAPYRDAVLERADVLHHEAALALGDSARDVREPDEARHAVAWRSP